MIRSKLGLLVLCAIAFGITAIPATSAQAALSWLILNSSKTTATELKAELKATTGVLALGLLTELVGLQIMVVCKEIALKNVNLETGGTLTEGGKVVFAQCSAHQGSENGTDLGCVVKSPGASGGTVETNGFKGQLVLSGGAVLAKIEPTGTDFVTLRFEECALTEANPVRGVLYFRDVYGATTHATTHFIDQSIETALYVGAHSSKKLEVTRIDGTPTVSLAGSHFILGWSAMDA